MGKEKFTPGPWFVGPPPYNSFAVPVYTAERLLIAQAIGSPNRSINSAHANAILITAAPRMLEALTALLEQFERFAPWETKEERIAADRAAKLIAEVKGE